MSVISRVVVLGAACAVVWVAWSGASTNAPVLALKRSAETGAAEVSLPSLLDAEREQLAVVPAADFILTSPSDVMPRPKDEPTLPTYTLAEAPPVPDLPELVTEPLEFEFFEPPYDARAIPQAVLLAALEFSRARRAAVGPETARWLSTMPEGFLEIYLASTTLDSGVQAWVHLSKAAFRPSEKVGQLLLFNPSTGVLAPEPIYLPTRLRRWEAEHLSENLSHADLDLDGYRELVVHDDRHQGTDSSQSYQHWFEIDGRLRTDRRFLSKHSSYVGWRGWHGSFRTRLIPVSAHELWAQAWYEPHREAERIALGHTVYHREGPDADYVPVYQVVNPDAPNAAGDGYATWMPDETARRTLELSWR